MIQYDATMKSLRSEIQATSPNWFDRARAKLRDLPARPKSKDFGSLWSDIKECSTDVKLGRTVRELSPLFPPAFPRLAGRGPRGLFPDRGIPRQELAVGPGVPGRMVNALCHRDYAIAGGAVFVAIYDDRLEVISLGLLPPGVTVADLKRDHASQNLGLIELTIPDKRQSENQR
jgi:hypothetical protein